ncbi:MAG: LysM peptidoglycan-binding domain-containing protein [Deltaproteobacteria bacterium]|nr:LysM peptidoglycan-binding domain-containing protein [Deltaproteobacteria bacterium]
MRFGRLAPVVCLAVALPGSLGAEEAAQAAPAAVAAEAAAEEAAPAQELLGPLGHDEQGRPGRVHVVVNGDTLWDISDAYLGTPWVWPSIWKDNTAEVENPHQIYPGERIWISPHEMRKISAAEAAEMLARPAPAEEPMPAAMADPDGPPLAQLQETYRYSEIETTGFVTSEELEGAATILDSTQPHAMLSDGAEIQVGLGQGEIAVGDQLDVFRPGEMVRDPETNGVLGHVTLQLGWLEITEVHEQSATGVIRLSRSEMYRGDHVMPRRVRSIDIAVGPRV